MLSNRKVRSDSYRRGDVHRWKLRAVVPGLKEGENIINKKSARLYEETLSLPHAPIRRTVGRLLLHMYILRLPFLFFLSP